MRARPVKHATTTAHPPLVSNESVEEALANQAARRGQKSPPKALPVTPTLPRQPKPHKKYR